METEKIAYGSKVKYIADILEKDALQKGPGWKLPTIQVLCNNLSTSINTILSALELLENKGIIYRKRGSGIYVSPEINKKTIGIVFGKDIFSIGISPIYKILLKTCIKRIKSDFHNESYSLYLDIPEIQNSFPETNTHYQLQKDIEIGKIDGILLMCIRSYQQLKWFQTMVPTVAFALEGQKETVYIDYKNLVETGVDILFQKGCKKIGLITSMGFLIKKGYYEDIIGYKNAVKKLNMKYEPKYIWRKNRINPEETNEEIGYRAMNEFYHSNKDIEGIVITDDMMTKGAIIAAKEYGIEIGKDIKIATHANKSSPTLNRYEKNLILLEIDSVEIVDNMLSLLEQWMEKDVVNNKRILIKAKIKNPKGGERI